MGKASNKKSRSPLLQHPSPFYPVSIRFEFQIESREQHKVSGKSVTFIDFIYRDQHWQLLAHL